MMSKPFCLCGFALSVFCVFSLPCYSCDTLLAYYILLVFTLRYLASRSLLLLSFKCRQCRLISSTVRCSKRFLSSGKIVSFNNVCSLTIFSFSRCCKLSMSALSSACRLPPLYAHSSVLNLLMNVLYIHVNRINPDVGDFEFAINS